MRTAIPPQGTPWPELRERMVQMSEGDIDWRSGKAAVYVFNAGEAVGQVQKEAYALFQSENGLGPLAFPSLQRMEAEVVEMALELLNAPREATGNVTSGGTDSITMAIKASRDRARDAGKSGELNIVLPGSAHPAFDKASWLMDLEVRRVPVAGETFLADPSAILEVVDEGTIMIVGSAPCFPYGVIDPIAELAEVARETGVWLHVDACVGGFLAPFARQLGVQLPEFDFTLAPVRSISADLHKYGYAAKGASTVLFRDLEDHAAMAFDFNTWPGGRMVTPTLAGTRPGGAISAAWAVMQFLGVEGYRDLQGRVLTARRAIAEGVTEQGWSVLGTPELGLIAFTRDDTNVYAVWRAMAERGWFNSVTTEPPSIHLMLSPEHDKTTAAYLADLEWAFADVQGGAPPVPAEPGRYGGG